MKREKRVKQVPLGHNIGALEIQEGSRTEDFRQSEKYFTVLFDELKETHHSE